MADNPFSSLLGSPKTSSINFSEVKIDSLIEDVFGISLSNKRPLVYMEEASAQSPNKLWNAELLENNLFDRLLMTKDQLNENFGDKLALQENEDSYVLENRMLLYLFKAFVRNEARRNDKDVMLKENCNRIRRLLIQNFATALKQPDIFPDQPSFSDQILQILKNPHNVENFDAVNSFISNGILEALNDDPSEDSMKPVREIFFKVFLEIYQVAQKGTLTSLESWIFPALQCFVSDKQNVYMAQMLLDFSTPAENCSGNQFSNTIFGQLLSISVMPKTHNGPYEYYDALHQTNLASIQNLSSTLWTFLANHVDSITQLFKNILLVGGCVRDKLLEWIARAINSNLKRGQIWTSHETAMTANIMVVPDSFMINLASVLLRLCSPLVRPQLKVLLVDSTITGVEDDQRAAKNVHIWELSKETCLLPSEEKRESANSFNFITEVFFMTHKAIDLGYRVCTEKLQRLGREVQRIHNMLQDTTNQGNPEVVKEHLTKITQHFMCLQNLLLNPKNNEMLLQFYEATAIYVMQLIKLEKLREIQDGKGYAPIEQSPLRFPIKKHSYIYLKYVPEILLENIVGYLQFEKNFINTPNNFIYEVDDTQAKENIFTMILAFMGSPERVKNPHLRARLADGLESFLPKKSHTGFQKPQMFEQHQHRLEIAENILSVFVSIEMTGQSVEFEQKFNYRRPMYAIMNHLWTIPEQRKCFEKLANDALERIEDVEVPVFLRFVNLLINDAIYLLDESLNNIQKIRTMEAARDNNEWDSLSRQEVAQNQSTLRHMGMFARFYNILGRDTINMVKLLTSEINGIFCHSSMVDRIATMLNYFLGTLVGPKKENFKVKDKKEYEFDPAHTVKDICQIYINLKNSEEFCMAVLQDGRSYSSKLFPFAENVLIRIGGGNLISEIQEFAVKLNEIEKSYIENELALVNPPDEFLDPIMSTLMRDPVILPSSKITVDRSTITRHLLSDQTDPFNREPLRIEQLVSDEELKKKIDEWVKEKWENYRKSKESTSENQ